MTLSDPSSSQPIAILHQELVERRHWISERRFLHALYYCMLQPGPEAQRLAIYLGWLMHRTGGGLVAGTLLLLSSLVILITLSWFYLAFGDMPLVAGLFYGIMPAVTAIVVQPTHRIGSRILKNSLLRAIAAASFLAIFALKLPFPLIVLSAALIGILGERITPDRFMPGSGHVSFTRSFGPAWVDDDRLRMLASAARGCIKFTAPLTAITAAVVGVILNLALFFGYHVLLPQVFFRLF